MIERIAIILLLNLLYFFKSLGYKYVSDDLRVFNSHVPFRNKWEKRYHQIEGRSRVNPVEDHAITIVIHAVISTLVYIGFGANDISFLAALFFSFNPINNQCSAWISGRGYAMAALGMLGALSFPLLSPAFLLFAAYYNTGFLAPAAFIGSPVAWIMVFMPFIWAYHYLRFHKLVKQKMEGEMFDEDKLVQARRLIIVVKTFGFYVTHALIPIKTTFYHSYLQSMAGSGLTKAYNRNDRFFWLGLVYILGIWTYWTWVPWNMVSFGLLWWCVGIAPFCNLIRMQQEISERYCYLPLPGLMFVLAAVLINHPVIAAFVLGMYATKLWFWMDAYQDDYYLAELACLNSPDAWFAWHVRAMKRWETGSYTEAVILWTMAKLISPKEFKILFNLATALRLGRHEKEALEFIEAASQVIPKGQEQMAGDLIKNWREGKMCVLL